MRALQQRRRQPDGDQELVRVQMTGPHRLERRGDEQMATVPGSGRPPGQRGPETARSMTPAWRRSLRDAERPNICVSWPGPLRSDRHVNWKGYSQ